MGRMAGVEMMKGDNPVLSIVNRTSSPLCDKISLPTVTTNNTIITVNGFPSTVDRTFLYPIRAQGCMTSSLPVYCTPGTQSSLILSPNAIHPSFVASPMPQVIGPIKSEQLTSFMETSPPQGNRTDTQPSISTNVFECRWMKCDRRFLQLDDMVNHVNDQHVKVERPDVDYQCKWTGCSRQGRGFNARYKMLIHIRTHTNEKPHKCLICGKSFSRLENLKIHNRSHTGEKPYICPFPGCSKAYSNSSDRFKHVRTHQDQKPYICKMPGCNKRYTDPSSLRKHVRTHGHYVNVSSENKNNNQTADVSAHIKGDNSQSPVTRSEDNKQFVILSASAPFSTRNSNGNLEKRDPYGDLLSSIDKQAMPLTLCTTSSISSSLNLSSINQSPLISPLSDLLPHVVTTVPVSFSETPDKISCDMECQDRPLDLSCSPVSPSVSLASLSPLSFQ